MVFVTNLTISLYRKRISNSSVSQTIPHIYLTHLPPPAIIPQLNRKPMQGQQTSLRKKIKEKDNGTTTETKSLTGTPQPPSCARCIEVAQSHILLELRFHAPSAHSLLQLRALRRPRSRSDQKGKETRIVGAVLRPSTGRDKHDPFVF